MGDFINFVIPGDWDDKARAKGIEFLELVISQEATLMGCFELPTLGEQIVCIYSKIIGLNDEN